MDSALTLSISWSDEGTSKKLDVLFLVLALALHAPLFYLKFDWKKKSFDGPTNRLVAIDLIEPEVPTPVPVVPPPVVKENTFLSRLKSLVIKEPPPAPTPKPVEKVPEKLNLAPKEIKIEPKLKLPEASQKLEGKAGFKTNLDPKLVEEKQISLKSMGAGVAPLTSKKIGMEDGGPVKSNKGSFAVAPGETLASIGGSGPALADASLPTIAIRTGKTAQKEDFSAAPKADKGKLGAVGVGGLAPEAKMGLRDSIIARDAPVGSIAIGKTSSAGAASAEAGGLGVKKDAGRYQVVQAPAGLGAGPGGKGAGEPVNTLKSIPPPVKAKPKKDLFTITGPLKDRKILQKELPVYPAWAQAQGIEAAVLLEFTVDTEGIVKDTVGIRRTSGYPQLDELSVKTLKKWKFIPLPEGESRDEVGLITFIYSLN